MKLIDTDLGKKLIKCLDTLSYEDAARLLDKINDNWFLNIANNDNMGEEEKTMHCTNAIIDKIDLLRNHKDREQAENELV